MTTRKGSIYLAVQPPHQGWRVKIGFTTQAERERIRKALTYAPDLEIINEWSGSKDREVHVRQMANGQLIGRIGAQNMKYIGGEVWEVPTKDDVDALRRIIQDVVSEMDAVDDAAGDE